MANALATPCTHTDAAGPCPHLATERGRCDTHQRQPWETSATATRQARGYDRTYDRLRRAAARRVERGDATCWRCTNPIDPGTPWNLGHSDDRRRIVGPEHKTCNDEAAARAGGHASHGTPLNPTPEKINDHDG